MNVILMLRAAKKQRQAIDLSTIPGNRDYGYLGVTRIVQFCRYNASLLFFCGVV
jgi:hypothetical protein